MARHKHADLMEALANDDELVIEYRKTEDDEWITTTHPAFYPQFQYRIKPKRAVWYIAMEENPVCRRWHELNFTKAIAEAWKGKVVKITMENGVVVSTEKV